MHAHEPIREAVMISPAAIEATERRRALALLLVGIGALIFAAAVLLYVLWMMLSSVQATAFDADGVRCYKSAGAGQLNCLKTAEPPR